MVQQGCRAAAPAVTTTAAPRAAETAQVGADTRRPRRPHGGPSHRDKGAPAGPRNKATTVQSDDGQSPRTRQTGGEGALLLVDIVLLAQRQRAHKITVRTNQATARCYLDLQ